MTGNRARTVNRLKADLESCANTFDRSPDNYIPDRILTWAFKARPRNDRLEHVLVKVVLLNTLYATQVFAVSRMAKHILECGLDRHLRQGDLKAVGLIRKGHGMKRDFYSFATKYCHWHRPDTYPMYDKYVAIALRDLNRSLAFTDPFSMGDLLNYRFFRETLDTCRLSLRLRWAGYKRLDQALWIYGQRIQ